jgi:hypothetical protein
VVEISYQLPALTKGRTAIVVLSSYCFNENQVDARSLSSENGIAHV